MAKFQIRDETFGLTLIEAPNATEALLKWVGRAAADTYRDKVVAADGGGAKVLYDGVAYEAVPAAAETG